MIFTFYVKYIPSPLIGPGLVSTSPATTSNSGKRGVAQTLSRRRHMQHRVSLPRQDNTPFPATHTPVSTFPTSESSSRAYNRGASEITRSRWRFSGTRGRDPHCAWYHRSFLFSQWPILARHSSGPLGGIFKRIRALWSQMNSPSHHKLIWYGNQTGCSLRQA